MGESGETEKQGDTVKVEKVEGEQIRILTPEEARIKEAIVKKMEQLRMKLRTTKGQMTKNMNKLELAITAFEKAETEGGSATRIKSKAEGINLYLENEMDTISSELKGVICESEKDELGVTQEQSIDALEEDLEKFLSRYEKLKEEGN